MLYRREIVVVSVTLITILSVLFNDNLRLFKILLSIILILIIAFTVAMLLMLKKTSKKEVINVCPKCKIEYGNDRISCPECKVNLIQLENKIEGNE